MNAIATVADIVLAVYAASGPLALLFTAAHYGHRTETTEEES